ncbi:hypothetical protein ACEPAH_7815 [Sanghuangporus vaninii]
MSNPAQISEQAHGNYPPPGDTTSEGGSSNARFDKTQIFAPINERGLVDQSTEGLPLGNEVQDAVQGRDETARKVYREEQKDNQPVEGRGNAGALNPYGESLETREEAEAKLKAGATDARARTYQAEIPNDKQM